MRLTRFSQSLKALVLIGAFSGGAAFAQGLSVLTGTVTDAATRQPVADVVVTATSPALQGEQIVVTDSGGNYRIPQLPPGAYTLRLEKESYKPYSRSDIVLRADRTIRVNVELLPEALKSEEIVIVGKAPTIDVGSASTGYTISSDFVKNIAVNRPSGRGGQARSFEALAAVAPQAQGDLFGVSINGTTSPENGYIVDGVSVADPAFGLNGTPLSAEFVQEVNVVTGGYLPEYGRSTGGVVTAVTKTGSNTFQGSIFGTWTPGALQASPKDVRREGSALSFSNSIYNIGDFGAELGGPILKDKLWFYVGIAPNFGRYKVTQSISKLDLDPDTKTPALDEFGFQKSTKIPGTDYNFFSDNRSIQYIGKLTYAITPDHTLSLSVNGTPTRGYNQEQQQFQTGPVNIRLQGDRGAQLFDTISDSTDVALKLNSSFLDKRLLFDVTGGWHNQHFAELPIDDTGVGTKDGLAGTVGIVYQRTPGGAYDDYHNILDFIGTDRVGYDAINAACNPNDPANTYVDPTSGFTRTLCPVQRWFAGGPGFIREGTSNRFQGKAIATYLLNLGGRHVWKAGVDTELTNYTSARAYTGQYTLTERIYGNGYTISRNYGVIEDPGVLTLRDKIETTVRAVSTGVFLQDSYTILDRFTINAGLRYDTQNLYGGSGELAFSLPSQVSPRVGAIYDFTGEGKSKIYANYAVYYENVPLNIADRGFAVEKQAYFRARNAGCRPPTPNGKTGTTDATNLDNHGTGTNPDPDYQKNCIDSGNIGGNPLLSGNSPNQGYAWISADKTVTDPNLKPMASNEIVAGGEYQIINDGRLGLVYTHRSLLQTIEDMSVDNGSSYFIGNPGYGIASAFPKATRDYDAATIFFDKSFSDGWMGQASYTVSRLFGNYNGLFVGSTGQLDPNSNATFDLISLLANQTGPLEVDATHAIKVFGAKSFVLNPKMALTLGVTYGASSGVPINYLAAHPAYGADEAYVLPRGSGGRTPWTHRIDSRLGFDYKLTDANTVSLGVDVFNLFNFQQVTSVDERYTAATILPLPNGTPDQLDKAVKNGEVIDQDQGVPFTEAGVNPNFKNATAYQQPRNVRFSVRVTF